MILKLIEELVFWSWFEMDHRSIINYFYEYDFIHWWFPLLFLRHCSWYDYWKINTDKETQYLIVQGSIIMNKAITTTKRVRLKTNK